MPSAGPAPGWAPHGPAEGQCQQAEAEDGRRRLYALIIGNDLIPRCPQVQLLRGDVPARVETHLWDHM
jgi:hypothetical protein